MSLTEYLGYAKAFLDSYGLTPAINAFVIVSLALALYFRFFGSRD